MDKAVNLLYNWLLALISILATLLMLEFALRLYVPTFSSQPDTEQAARHHYDPLRSHRLNPTYNTKVNTEGRKIHSSDGFRRDTPVTVKKPPQVIRIFALGGSTLYGLGINSNPNYPDHRDLFNDETITHFLEQQLNAALSDEGSSCRVEVINAGVTAYRTSQEFIYLNTTLLDYQPDIIISLDGHNGFYGDDRGQHAWQNYSYGTYNLLRTINHRDFIPALHTFIRWAANYSMLASQLEQRISIPWYDRKVNEYIARDNTERQKDTKIDYSKYAGKTYLRDLWQINRLGGREGYDHMVFLQPEVILEDNAYLTDNDGKMKATTLRLLDKGADEDYQRKREMMPALFQVEGIPFVDIGAIGRFSDGKTDLYIDYCHLTPAGSKIVADKMFDYVLPLVLKRTSNCQLN